MIDRPAPSTNRICNSMGSLAWVEPTGVTHWIDDSFTHPTWAYMHLNPGFNRDDFIRLDDEIIDAQDALLKSGWLRVSSMSSIEMEDPDTLDQRAWDTWSEIAAPCAGKFGYEPESMIMIGYGLEELGYMKVPMAEVVETYCSKRAQDKFWSMAMGESLVRNLIRSILSEDLAGFRKKAASHEYRIDIEKDPTFEEDREARKNARALKTAWKEEADHQFMESVTKIHWMKDINPEKMRKFLSSGRKDEISTMGYLKPPYTNWGWGGAGFQLQGRTTIAHNDMNRLYTGYFSGPGQFSRMWKYRHSGVPKRPQSYRDTFEGAGYILDEDSFRPDEQGYNEFLVDNWKPIGFVLTESTYNTLKDVLDHTSPNKWREFEGRSPMTKGEMWTQIFQTIEEFKIPYMKRKHANLAKEWLNAAR